MRISKMWLMFFFSIVIKIPFIACEDNRKRPVLTKKSKLLQFVDEHSNLISVLKLVVYMEMTKRSSPGQQGRSVCSKGWISKNALLTKPEVLILYKHYSKNNMLTSE